MKTKTTQKLSKSGSRLAEDGKRYRYILKIWAVRKALKEIFDVKGGDTPEETNKKLANKVDCCLAEDQKAYK